MKALVGRLDEQLSRTASASGGAFYAIAKGVVARGGCVCGVAWDDDFKGAHFEIATTEVELERLRGSKYVVARMGDILVRVKALLDEGRQVCFSGCPCQIATLLKFLNGAQENLLTIELICSGVPDEILLRRSIENLEARKHSRVVALSMRKEDSGRPFMFQYRLDGDSAWRTDRWLNRTYVRLWMSGLAKRASCLSCEFKRSFAADLTIGDAWGVQRYARCGDDGRGLSVLIANTPRGECALSGLMDFTYNEVDVKDVIAGNPPLQERTQKQVCNPEHRARVLKALQNGDGWQRVVSGVLELGWMATGLRLIKRICK